MCSSLGINALHLFLHTVTHNKLLPSFLCKYYYFSIAFFLITPLDSGNLILLIFQHYPMRVSSKANPIVLSEADSQEKWIYFTATTMLSDSGSSLFPFAPSVRFFYAVCLFTSNSNNVVAFLPPYNFSARHFLCLHLI